ncbi:hypothetical protein K525DRAFT_291831 [Schizophyllum commune Loenen D]|nr:hypothetical protein K525DRAFT_291831 [Schizophyllum commune Loenen D]
MRKWVSPIYAFYYPTPDIEYVPGKSGSRRSHVFTCFNKGCKKKVRRYLDTNDKVSTSNMIRHAQSCWGQEAVSIAQSHGNATDARAKVAEPLKVSGKITAAFARQGKGKVTYSTRQHTKTETKYTLMKTGRPEYYIPSRSTVSRDVKRVFARTRTRVAELLQNHEGDLSFVTDMWTSPNHVPYMGTTVTLEHNGEIITLVLDVTQVAKVHRVS